MELENLPEILEGNASIWSRSSRVEPPADRPEAGCGPLFPAGARWLELGCIVFSQYYDTAHWVAQSLTAPLPGERVALYAGAGKSGVFFDGEWRSVEREEIKAG